MVFLLFFLMKEESRTVSVPCTNESGFVPCTYGSRSGRPKNIRIRFQIRNTAFICLVAFTCFCLVWSLAFIYSCHICHSPCIVITLFMSFLCPSPCTYCIPMLFLSLASFVVVNPVLVLLLALLVLVLSL